MQVPWPSPFPPLSPFPRATHHCCIWSCHPTLWVPSGPLLRRPCFLQASLPSSWELGRADGGGLPDTPAQGSPEELAGLPLLNELTSPQVSSSALAARQLNAKVWARMQKLVLP